MPYFLLTRLHLLFLLFPSMVPLVFLCQETDLSVKQNGQYYDLLHIRFPRIVVSAAKLTAHANAVS